MSASQSPAPAPGWRVPAGSVSLPEVHGSIAIPTGAGFWRKLFAFAGPGYLVAVGYMDPGNWATDLAGGARYGYTLLSVIMISNFMAILLQALSARLGIASGRDLAQACRDSYSRPMVIGLWTWQGDLPRAQQRIACEGSAPLVTKLADAMNQLEQLTHHIVVQIQQPAAEPVGANQGQKSAIGNLKLKF